MITERVIVYLMKETIKKQKINQRRIYVDINDDGENVSIEMTYLKKKYGKAFKYGSDTYNKRFMLDKYIDAGFNPERLTLDGQNLAEHPEIIKEVELARVQVSKFKDETKRMKIKEEREKKDKEKKTLGRKKETRKSIESSRKQKKVLKNGG